MFRHTHIPILSVLLAAAPAQAEEVKPYNQSHSNYQSPEQRAQDDGRHAAWGMALALGVIDSDLQVRDPWAKPPQLIFNDDEPRTRWDLEDYKVDGTGRKQKALAERLRMQLDTTIGFDGNIYGSPDESDESVYGSVDFKIGYQFTPDWKIALGLTEYLYEEAHWSRPGGDDNLIHNYSFGSELYYRFTNHIHYNSEANLVYGGLGNILLNDPTTGILERDRTYIELDTSIFVRPDGKDLSDNGWYGQLGSKFNYYNQSGEDEFDTDDRTVSLGLTRVVNKDLSLLASVGYRERNWDSGEYDADGYLFRVGARGNFPCGARYELSLHHETRDYDERRYDDRNLIGYNLDVSGDLKEYEWRVRSSYGFRDPNIAGNNMLDLVDAEGHLMGAHVSREFGNGFSATLFCIGLLLEGDIADATDLETHNVFNGLRLEKEISDDMRIGATLGHQKVSYEFANAKRNEDSAFFSLNLRKDF